MVVAAEVSWNFKALWQPSEFSAFREAGMFITSYQHGFTSLCYSMSHDLHWLDWLSWIKAGGGQKEGAQKHKNTLFPLFFDHSQNKHNKMSPLHT